MKTEFIRTRRDDKGNETPFVLYPGLLDEAHTQGLQSITTELIQLPTPENGHSAVVKVRVITSKGVFEAIGDADPGNVTPYVRPHLIRMAETRGKARALRDAVNVAAALEADMEDAGFAERVQSNQQQPAARERPRPERRAERAPGAPAAAQQEGAQPHNNGARVASEAQVRLIYSSAGRHYGWDRAATDQVTRDLYVAGPAGLTPAQASELITRLQRKEFAQR